MVDLKKEIEKWQQEGDILIIGGDWNEEVSSSSWCAFWHDVGLVSLAGLIQRQPIATYSHGQKQLDMVYVSPILHQVPSGYINFSNFVLGTDHYVLWLDVPATSLYLQPPPPHMMKG